MADDNEEYEATTPVQTHTSFWALEKKLYAINDLALPFPVPLKAVGITVAVGLPWWGLLWLFHVPFTPPIYLLYFVPPVLGFLGTKSLAMFDYKNVFQWVTSMVGYVFQPRHYEGLFDRSGTGDEVEEYVVDVSVWQKRGKERVKPKRRGRFQRK